jgi:hypothetical protein
MSSSMVAVTPIFTLIPKTERSVRRTVLEPCGLRSPSAPSRKTSGENIRKEPNEECASRASIDQLMIVEPYAQMFRPGGLSARLGKQGATARPLFSITPQRWVYSMLVLILGGFRPWWRFSGSADMCSAPRYIEFPDRLASGCSSWPSLPPLPWSFLFDVMSKPCWRKLSEPLQPNSARFVGSGSVRTNIGPPARHPRRQRSGTFAMASHSRARAQRIKLFARIGFAACAR